MTATSFEAAMLVGLFVSTLIGVAGYAEALAARRAARRVAMLIEPLDFEVALLTEIQTRGAGPRLAEGTADRDAV